MKKTFLTLWVMAWMGVMPMLAQPQFSQPHGLYDGGSLSVSMTSTAHYQQDDYHTRR